MKSIETLYSEYRQDVYRYLLGLTRDPSRAEDLLSETFVQAIRGVGRFRGDSSVRTWLFGIARRLWLHSLRGTCEDSISELEGLVSPENPQDRTVHRQALKRIAALLSELDERAQLIFRLRFVGFSYAEIAQRSGVSENSARVIAFRTRGWLKEKLEEEGLL